MSEELNNGPEGESAFAVLRRFARRRTSGERCELCSAEVGSEHSHLLELANRHILCACEPCAILFSETTAARYRRVPRRARWLSDFQLSDQEWDSLMLPINLAFFYHDSSAGRIVAMYPSPAGATESLLSLEAWSDLEAQNPALQKMELDVEALLVNRVGSQAEYFVVPIDECYRLVGLIRTNWRGLSGGTKVWDEIKEFFTGLKRKCGVFQEAANA
jgi:hypothetical protein